ncbi:MAG: tetratricopeptide repeat protein [Planctomycetota bacterium]
MTNSEANAFRKRTRLHILILVFAVGLVWSFGIFGEFVWIDRVEILEAGYRVTSWNDFQAIWSTSLDAYLERDFGNFESNGGYLRPIYALCISLDWWIWGGNPLPYKIHNIFWHGWVVIGLYFLGRQIFLRRNNGDQISFASTLLFAIHPCGVHSVTWISGRKDTMCAAFCVTALLILANLISRKVPIIKIPAACGLATMVFALGIFSKELAFVTPIFATVLVWYRFDPAKTQEDHFDAIQHGPRFCLGAMWILAVLGFGYRKIVLGGTGLNAENPFDSVLQWLVNSGNLIFHFIGVVLVPVDPTIVDRWPTETVNDPLAVSCAIGVVALLIFAWIMVWYRKPLGIGLAWFFIWLVPATGVISLNHVYAERYLYPASWGLILAAVYLSDCVARKFKSPIPLTAPIFAISILWCSWTIIAIGKWNSEDRLFSHALDQDEHYVEGLMYFGSQAMQNHDPLKAIEFLQKANESLLDDKFQSYGSKQVLFNNLGQASLDLHDYGSAKNWFEKLLQVRPNNALTMIQLAKANQALSDYQQSERYYLAAFKLNPGFEDAVIGLSSLYLESGRYIDCIELLIPWLAQHPENHQARVNAGSAMILRGEFELAVQQFSKAVDLDPDDAGSLAKLAWCHFELLDLEKGNRRIDQAKQIQPDNPTVKFVLEKYSRQ